jgi:hypothetical protein
MFERANVRLRGMHLYRMRYCGVQRQRDYAKNRLIRAWKTLALKLTGAIYAVTAILAPLLHDVREDVLYCGFGEVHDNSSYRKWTQRDAFHTPQFIHVMIF